MHPSAETTATQLENCAIKKERLMSKIAHISDLHIVDNAATLKSVFWDFILLAGPPAALVPVLKPHLDDPAKREEIWKKLLYHSDREEVDPRKVAAITALSLPIVVFLLRSLVRLKRIFYLRKDTETARKILLADLKSQGIDNVVLTGDLTNTASKTEYEIANRFVKSLRAFAKVMIIPGNHDINVQRLAAMDPKRKLDRYLNHFGDRRRKHAFPFMRHIGDLCLIGLDSTVFNPLFNTRGEISVEQMDRLNDLLHTPDVRGACKAIMLHHHLKPGPREFRLPGKALDRLAKAGEAKFMDGLRNADDLLALAGDHDVELCLHGHKHRLYEQKAKGTKVLCAGSTTQSDSRRPGQLVYRIIEQKSGRISIYERRIQKEAKDVE